MNIFLVCSVYFLAAITPGPSQFLILETALLQSPRDARWTALGVSLGTFTWVAFVVWGLHLFLSYVPQARLFTAWLSVALLLFFVFKNVRAMLLEKRSSSSVRRPVAVLKSRRSSFVAGLLVNLFNPNSVVFFMTLFAPLVSGKISRNEVYLSVLGVTVISVLWYQLIAEIWRFKPFYKWLQKQSIPLRSLITGFYLYWAISMILRLHAGSIA